MAYGIGLRVLRSMCEAQNPMHWHRAKLSAPLFKAHEVQAFEYVENHLKKYHVLPKPETLFAQFPDAQGAETPEPPGYYVSLLENQYFHARINDANIESQNLLKANQDDHEKAVNVLTNALLEIKDQKYRTQIVDVGAEAKSMLLKEYGAAIAKEDPLFTFGWPYMDEQAGGGLAGDIISYVGRPATGKSWKMLWSTIKNWKLASPGNTLFVSMEMGRLPIVQRIATIYASAPISQLKKGMFSTQTYQKFHKGLNEMGEEKNKLYVLDGNLAANMDDIYMLADLLQCTKIFIDGGYLVRHKNARLDRFNRAAENVELAKRLTEDIGACTAISWQFNREAAKKSKAKSGGDTADLEDIGYSDAIGQISSIALGLFQDDGVETMVKRNIRLLKGRSGEIGQFAVKWDFDLMDFSQVDSAPVSIEAPADSEALDYV